jgi:nucleotide-binding universal stress UspA family protein
VLVAKVGSGRPYQRVVIAFDRSEAAQRALAAALALAPRAEFHLVHAWQKAEAGRADEEGTERTRLLLANAAERITRRSLYPHTGVSIEVGEGTPVHVIATAVAALDADLLATGTHGRGRLQTALFGSVAQELLVVSPCDVLLAPPH